MNALIEPYKHVEYEEARSQSYILTNNLSKPFYCRLGVIAGLGTLFLSKTTTHQRAGSILTMISLATMHLTFSKAREQANAFTLGKIQIASTGTEGILASRTLEVFQKTSSSQPSSMISARKIGEKVVQIGTYLAGTALLLRSPTALKVLFLMTSGIYVKNLFSQYSSSKAAVDNYICHVWEATRPGHNEPVSLKYFSNMIARHKDYLRAYPRDSLFLYGLTKAYLGRCNYPSSSSKQEDLAEAEKCLDKMKKIKPQDQKITDLSNEIAVIKKNGFTPPNAGLSSVPINQSDEYRKHFEAGNQYLQKGDFNSAYTSFNNAYKQSKNQQDPQLCIRLGYSLLRLFLDEKTSKDNIQKKVLVWYEIDTAYENREDSADPIFHYAYAEMKNQIALNCLDPTAGIDKNQLAKALSSAKKAIMLAVKMDSSPRVLFHLFNIAKTYGKAGKVLKDKTYFSHAIELLEKYVELNPKYTDPAIAVHLGYLYQAKERPDLTKAKTYLLHAQSLGYTDNETFSVAQLLEHIKKLESKQSS